MAKELPYFKFEPAEWNDGDITLCTLEEQGLFINLCSLYWSKLGVLNYTKVKRRFKDCNSKAWESILNDGVIKVSEDMIIINFLDDQLEEFLDIRKKRSDAGRRGGKNRALSPEEARIKGHQFYVIHCYNDTEEFIKCGVTSRTISRRFSGKMPYSYDIVFQQLTDDFLTIESECSDRLRSYSYDPKLEFNGKLECYKLACINDLNDILEHRTSKSIAKFKPRNASREEEKKEEEKKEEKSREKENKKPPEFLQKAKSIAEPICKYYSIGEVGNFQNWKMIVGFCEWLLKEKKEAEFQKQFEAYKSYKETTGETRHGWRNFIGEHPDYQGIWTGCDWVDKLKNCNPNQNGFKTPQIPKQKFVTNRPE